MPEYPNEWYLEGLKSGRGEVIETIFSNYLPVITGFITRNSGTGEDARDIFMDAMESLFKRLRKGELILTCSFSTYLFEICKRLWWKRLRRKKYHSKVTAEDLNVSNVAVEMEPWLEQTEQHQLMREKFGLLGEVCRQLLALSWRTDKSMQEIAEDLDLSYAYARKRKYKCKEHLIRLIRNDVRYLELN